MTEVALLYPGDRAMRDRCDPAESRFAALFEALRSSGIRASPAVYHDDFAGEVEAQLDGAAVVQVWCNPIEGGRRRDRLDAMLRRVADRGTLVSAHPDAVLRLGTKDVLFETRDLPFGSDVHRIDSLDQLAAELPERLRRGARVLKQHRGHSGIGIWKVERAGSASSAPLVRVRHAQRGSEEELMALAALIERLAPYFDAEQGGHMIDQAWQTRLADGMVRAYLVGDRVEGFGWHALNALYPGAPGQPAAQPGTRVYHDAGLQRFQGLKRRLESGWIESLRTRVGLPRDRLPLLWDCDFMFGEPTAHDAEPFVLGEINVSSVSPFPPSCIDPMVRAIAARLSR